MKRAVTRHIVAIGVACGLLPVPAAAQTHSLSATGVVSLTVPGAVKLTLSVPSISFADSNPDLVPSIPASTAVGIIAKARSTPGSPIVLSVLAGSDLVSGGDTIPASALSWTASGPGFVPGTISKAAARQVGSWTSAGSWTGSQLYFLANSWNYAVGNYSVTLTYTLSAP